MLVETILISFATTILVIFGKLLLKKRTHMTSKCCDIEINDNENNI